MRFLVRTCVFASSFVLLIVSTALADVAQRDLRQLQGGWRLIQLTHNGRMTTFDDHIDGWVLKIAGYRYSQGPLVPGRDGSLTLGAHRWPKEIDLRLLSGPHAGKTMRGIYDVAGDTFRVAFAPPDGARPVNFSARKWGETSYLWMRIPRLGPLQAWPELVAPEFSFESR